MSNKPTSAGNQQESLSSVEQRRWFLAGVIEGEGSVYVGIKAHPTVPLGFFVQPGFSITQHRIRRSLLEMAKREFGGVGSIFPKPGNESVLVYSIHSRPMLARTVQPSLERYMRYSSRADDFRRFGEILCLFEAREHRNAAGLARIVGARIRDEFQRQAAQASARRRTRQNPQRPYARRPDAGAMRWSDLHGDVES